jgi:uncharacterized protein DUF928
MKYLKLAIFIFIGIALTLTATAKASEDKSALENSARLEGRLLPSASLPLYKPPLRSIPGGRLKGTNRGGAELPVVQVLAPNHVGLTQHKQATLYWYLSKTTTYPVEFTLVDSRAIPPVYETRLPQPTEPGVQRIRLRDHGVNLEAGVTYRWFVTIVVDPSNPSKDVTAGGVIERVSYLEGMIIHPASEEDPVALAAAGLWYDAIRAISTKIEASPADPFYRRQRAFLLEQVGLSEVAQFDLGRR